MTTLLDVSTTITPQEVVQFTEGDCWILAEALWMAAGNWTLVAIGVCEENPVEENPHGFDLPFDLDWVHMAVQTPDGRIVDIEGVHTDIDSYLKRWATSAENTHGYVEPMTYLFEVFEYEDFEKITRDQFPLYSMNPERVDQIVAELITQVS